MHHHLLQWVKVLISWGGSHICLLVMEVSLEPARTAAYEKTGVLRGMLVPVNFVSPSLINGPKGCAYVCAPYFALSWVEKIKGWEGIVKINHLGKRRGEKRQSGLRLGGESEIDYTIQCGNLRLN